MKLYYYCSYKFSPTGFQLQCYDGATGKTLRRDETNSDDKLISHLFSHGGAESAFGCSEPGRYYFLIKQIKIIDTELSQVDKGYQWYINLAVSADKDELPLLQAIAYWAYTDFEAFKKAVYDTLSLGDDEISFRVDTAAFMRCIEKVCQQPQSSEPDYVFGLDKTQLGDALQILKSGEIKHRFEFVIFSDNSDYFYKNCKIDPTETVYHSASIHADRIEADKQEQPTQPGQGPDDETSASETAKDKYKQIVSKAVAGVAIGFCAGLVLTGAVVLGKKIFKGRK